MNIAPAHALHATALLLLVASPALGQQPDSVTVRPVPRVAKVGKWVLLGATLGMGLLAAKSHDRAEAAYDDLEAYCAVDRRRCDLTPGGKYIDPVTEGLYQSSLDYDSQARRWFLGGEVALLGAAAMFIWEFSKPHDRPDDIPFDPEIRVTREAVRLGGSLAF